MTTPVQRSFPESIVPITSVEAGCFQFLEKHIPRNILQSVFEQGKTEGFKQIKFCLKTLNKIEKIVEYLPVYYALWLHMVQMNSKSDSQESCLKAETMMHAHTLFMTIVSLAALAKTCKISMRTYKSIGNRYAVFIKDKIPEGGDLRSLFFGKNDDRAMTIKKVMSVSYLAYALSLGANALVDNGLTNAVVLSSKMAVTLLKESRRMITIFRGIGKWQNESADRQKLAGSMDEADRIKLLKKLEDGRAKQSFFYTKMGLHMGRFALNLAGTRLLHPLIAIRSAFLNLGKSVRSKEEKKKKLEAKELKNKDKKDKAVSSDKVKIKEPKVKEPKVIVNPQWTSKEYRQIFLVCAAIVFIAHAVFFKSERFNYCV